MRTVKLSSGEAHCELIGHQNVLEILHERHVFVLQLVWVGGEEEENEGREKLPVCENGGWFDHRSKLTQSL